MITLLAVAEDASGADLLVPAPPELIWGFVAFLLLMAAMSKLVFPKANQTLEDRAAAIQGKMEEADAQLADAERSKAEFDAQIADAKGSANQIVEQAKTDAEAVRADIVARAEDEAAQMLEKARTDVAAERDRLLSELRTQVGTLSVELASRIVERELDAATHQSLVDEYIQDLSSAN